MVKRILFLSSVLLAYIWAITVFYSTLLLKLSRSASSLPISLSFSYRWTLIRLICPLRTSSLDNTPSISPLSFIRASSSSTFLCFTSSSRCWSSASLPWCKYCFSFRERAATCPTNWSYRCCFSLSVERYKSFNRSISVFTLPIRSCFCLHSAFNVLHLSSNSCFWLVNLFFMARIFSLRGTPSSKNYVVRGDTFPRCSTVDCCCSSLSLSSFSSYSKNLIYSWSPFMYSSSRSFVRVRDLNDSMLLR